MKKKIYMRSGQQFGTEHLLLRTEAVRIKCLIQVPHNKDGKDEDGLECCDVMPSDDNMTIK